MQAGSPTLTTGRAKLLLQLSKLCEATFEEAKNNAISNKIGRDENQNLVRAVNNLNDTNNHPPAPMAPAGPCQLHQ